MTAKSRKIANVDTFSADVLLLAVAVALSAALLWPLGGRAVKAEPPLLLRPVAWANDRLLPEPITPLSSLYHVSDRYERLTLRVKGGKAGTALLVWLEGEWVVMPWEGVPGEYRVSFDGWRPEYITVAALPAATRGR